MIRIRHVVTGITLMLALAACRGPEAEQARQDAAAAADHAAAATDQVAIKADRAQLKTHRGQPDLSAADRAQLAADRLKLHNDLVVARAKARQDNVAAAAAIAGDLRQFRVDHRAARGA